MNRKKFIITAGAATITGAGIFYLLSDRENFSRNDVTYKNNIKTDLLEDERNILFLASLAPSGHNTQPWIVRRLEPFHWILCNDKNKWLPAVDPTQRETILSLGAFTQNLEYAANAAGYSCLFTLLAATNQDEKLLEIKLVKGTTHSFDIDSIKRRRTVRSDYLNDPIKKEDIAYLLNNEITHTQFIERESAEYRWLNEQTIEANRIQTNRDEAQKELSEWIRFSSKEAEAHYDGLTTASMEIHGLPAWLLRNFYKKENVMLARFRNQGLDKVREQVMSSGGWLLITSKDQSVMQLLEAGRRLQRIFLKVRNRSIAFHPMTQILEEAETKHMINKAASLTDPIQFIIRVGYLKAYPQPVSLRKPPEWFVNNI